MLRYKLDVISELKNKGFSTYVLRTQKIMGTKSIYRIKNGEMIGIIELNKLCELLNMQPGKIIEWIPDNKEPGKE